MSAPLKMYRKTVIERRRLYVDYSCWLPEAEKLTDFQVTIVPYTDTGPLVVDTSFPDPTNKKLMIFVSGGVAKTIYQIAMVVRTDAGQVKRDDIGVSVSA